MVGLARTVAGKRSRHLIHTPLFLSTAPSLLWSWSWSGKLERQGEGRTRTDNAFCPALSDGAASGRGRWMMPDQWIMVQMDRWTIPGRDLFGWFLDNETSQPIWAGGQCGHPSTIWKSLKLAPAVNFATKNVFHCLSLKRQQAGIWFFSEQKNHLQAQS